MTNATVGSTAPRKRGGWLKILGIALGVLIVLLIVVYFVATSSGFFKSVILPRVSKSVGAEITVSDASISPFSEVVLHNLKVQTTGTEPLVTATEARARYNLRAILGGNILVDELTVTSPTVTIVENPDGSSNLDPFTASKKSDDKKKSEAAKTSTASKPVHVDIRKVTLTEGTVRQLKMDKSGDKDVAEISHLNVTLENVRNGQTGKVTVNAGVRAEKSSSKPEVSGVIEAKASGEYDFSLSADLDLASAKGNTHLEISRAEGAFGDVSGGSLALDCEVTPTEVKELSLHLQKGTKRLGEVRASGPFSLQKKEGKLTVQVLSIDRQLLNLVGARQGIKFGTTTINSSNEVEIAKAGFLITALGKVDVSKFQMKRASNTTPTLDLHADYDVTVDLAQSNSVLRNFTLTGMQGGSQLLHGELTSPMSISWGSAKSEMGDSTFNLSITALNLPDWKPFLGESVSQGKLNAQAKVISQKGGDSLTFDISSQGDDISARFGSNAVSQAGFNLQVNGQATAMKQFNLKSYSLQVAHRKDPVISVTGSGTFTRSEKENDADMQVAVQAFLTRLMEISPQPGSALSSGTIELKGHVVQKGQDQSITGSFVLADLTGNFGPNQFKSFGATADLDVAMKGEEVDIRKAAGKVTEGGKAGGSFDVSGKMDTAKKTAQITARLSEFNETGLRFALEPMLADKKLVTVALNANAAIQYDPQASSSFKGDLQVSKLVVNDPKGEFPKTPLETKMQFDVSMKKAVTDIRQFQITLTPTSRGKNEVQLTGQVDATLTNAITGNLKLTADSLDLTTYYDLFMGDKKPATQTASSSASASPASAPSSSTEKEPDPHVLPFRNFTASATINKFYLREVEIADAQAQVKIDGGHVVVNPFKLGLNGAPVNANIDLDIGIPGYKYDVSFGADRVPLAPLVNSFTPERKGQIGGTFIANAGLEGQGITGPSLQKNLSGKFQMASTNLNLAVINIKSPLMKTLINVVASIPELLSNPTAGLTSLVQGALGLGKGGLSGELSQSPVQAIAVSGQVGAGQVTLSQAEVRSSAFLAEASGNIILAPVLTNSAIQIPVSISLSRPIAMRLGQAPPDVNTNQPYVKLDDFLTMKGTVGNSKPDISILKVTAMALKSAGGIGGKAGGIIQGVSGLLGGRTATNSAGTNQSGNAVGGLIQGLGGLLGNTGNTATNSATNQQSAPVNNLLNDLFAPKKK